LIELLINGLALGFAFMMKVSGACRAFRSWDCRLPMVQRAEPML